MKTSLYAVGLTRGFIELRRAIRAPVKHTSSVDVVTKRKMLTGYGTNGKPSYEDQEVKTKIRALHFTGGKVLGAVHSTRFHHVAGVSLRTGSVRRLDSNEEKIALQLLGRQ